MFIQITDTPNPSVKKFILNKTISEQYPRFYTNIESAKKSALASKIFSINGIESILIEKDFISITKKSNESWNLLLPLIFSTINDYLSHTPSSTNASHNTHSVLYDKKDQKIVQKIQELLDTRVRPFVLQDGGYILFHEYRDGIVYVSLQGACAGCPSSQFTLQSGIENMLKHFLPNDIKEIRNVSWD